MTNEEVARWFDDDKKLAFADKLKEILSKHLYVGLNFKTLNGLPTAADEAEKFLAMRLFRFVAC